MNRQSDALRSLLPTLGLFVLLAPTVALAQTKAAGELLLARQTTLNGTAAVSGVTIFSNNRVKTTAGGAAIINLGKIGRIELDAKTELALRFSAATVGGELLSGRATMSVPAGVALALTTAKGVITSDGKQASILTVEVMGETARVVARLGAAQINTGGKVERVLTGDELTLGPSSRGAGWQRQQLALMGAAGVGGAIAAAGAAGAQRAVPIVQSAPAFTRLVNASLNYSIQRLTSQNVVRDPEIFFDPTITCRDHDNFLCRRRSGVNP